MRFTYTQYVNVFRALSDETRLQIVALLCENKHCACHLLEHFNITQPTLSYHLKILIECEIICACKESTMTRYSLHEENSAMIHCFIKDVTSNEKEKEKEKEKE